jgi:two-component system cell cycle sensor histidine kinase/response regulator CckA
MPLFGFPGRNEVDRMSVLRRFLPKVLLVGLFLSVAIFPLVEKEAGTAADPLTLEERAFVAANGPIRYAPDPLFPPFEFLDSSRVARGITPDLLAIMGKKLGVEFRTVAYPTWSDVLDAVKRGEVDLLGTLTRTPEREGFLLFSRSYLSVPYVLFVRQEGDDPESIDDMVSRRLGVVKNYGINTWLSAEHPNIRPVAVEDTATGLTMVATGQLDAMLETLPVGAQIVREKSLTNIRIVPRHIYTLPQHFGVRRSEPLLLSIVQKGMDSLTETERSEVFVRWTGQDFSRPSPAITPFLRNTLFFLVAAAVFSLAWIATLRRSVRRATRSLRESEERYRELFENANDIIYTHDLAGNFTSINKAAQQATGYTLDEALKTNIFSVLAPESVDVVRQMMSRRGTEGGQTQYELEIVRKDGRRVPLEVSTRIIFRGGKPVGVQGIARNITERKRGEETLRESEERFRVLSEQSPLGMALIDHQGRYGYVNPAFVAIFGYTLEEVPTGADWFRAAFPDPDVRREAIRKWKEDRARSGVGEARPRTFDVTCKDGARKSILFRSVSLSRGRQFVIYEDVTRQRELQAQLQQAMKMEAVGRLAGGIAHDFNNLLTVIIGNVSLALVKLAPSDPAGGLLAEVSKAAERAALLTQQLLAFSRKQIIEPKVLNLNDLIADLNAMLVRLIREDIKIEILPGKDLGAVKIDPGQFQQVLINLVVNARDAMPGGGKIIIETANRELDDDYCYMHPYVEPGRFVMVAVSDTGHGMGEEVTAHIFEPFFTTKPKGKGTGLGLATTHGVVKQSGGSIEVYSEVGIGTTFKIYLPRVEEKVSKPARDDQPRELLGGTETVLLVEDEEIVRDLCVRILCDSGYRVFQAGNGDEAIALATGFEERIDLLLTDVVMPGMSGPELATQLVLHHPETKVLFTSGYTENAITRHGALKEGVNFINKPYTPSSLAKKVREVLDNA